MSKPKVAIIYYSATGTTHQLAEEIQTGAREAGADVRLLRVAETAPEQAIQSNPDWAAHRDATADMPEATMDDVRWADAIVLGTPTRYGTPTAQLKNFIDQTGPLWAEGAMVDKIGSSFASAATPHGGHESTLVALNNTFQHWGAIVVTPGYADPIQFSAGTPYGTSFVSQNGTLDPDENTRQAARFQGSRVAKVTKRLHAGERELAHA